MNYSDPYEDNFFENEDYFLPFKKDEQSNNMNQLDFLGTVLYDFCKLNSLELQSAGDILHSEFDNLTIHQRDWLSNYIQVWENIVNEVE